MSRAPNSFVLGFHGCDREIGLKIVRGEVPLAPGNSKYDWMGSGIYFWENDPIRALEWAEKKKARGHCKDPFVIGAVIDPGNCLDLLVRENVELVKFAYDSFTQVQKKAGLRMPVNRKAPKDDSDSLVMRYLDCAVINHLHSILDGPDKPQGLTSYDTVRAVFVEGAPMYTGAMLFEQNHVQIAVRNTNCIKGTFIPRDIAGSLSVVAKSNETVRPK